MTPATAAEQAKFAMPMTRRESARQLTTLINTLTAAADQIGHLLPDYQHSEETVHTFRAAADAALAGLTYTLSRPS